MALPRPKERRCKLARVTRRLTTWRVLLYDTEIKPGGPEVKLVCETSVEAFAMSRQRARLAARDAIGRTRLSPTMFVEWEPASYKTYSMPLDEFMAHAVLVDSGTFDTTK